MLAVAYVIAFEPARAGDVIGALGQLSAIWIVGLSVLGIYVYKRSQEKTSNSHSAPNFLSELAWRFGASTNR